MQTDSRNSIATGDAYVRAISARAADRDARSEFQKTVLAIAPPRGRIFDFGAGPGTDAKFYAEHGFRVFAYDIDVEMCATFRVHCCEEITTERVTLIESPYDELLSGALLRNVRDIDLVTANFAPMNLVPDPQEAFETFHSIVADRGQLLLSVLNPSFIGDMRYRWFWTNRRQLWRDGHFVIRGSGPRNVVWRRSVGEFTKLSAAGFRLRKVLRGLPTPPWWTAAPMRWLARPTSQFLFLLFDKR
jgi:SAM-dependent methyltransferase